MLLIPIYFLRAEVPTEKTDTVQTQELDILEVTVPEELVTPMELDWSEAYKKNMPKQVPRNYKLDDNLLFAICSCEGGLDKNGRLQQYEDDGVTVRWGRLTPTRLGTDVGMCQINTKYHLESSKSLGYDIMTAEGNWGYAKYLLQTQGTRPWKASESCWSKKI